MKVIPESDKKQWGYFNGGSKRFADLTFGYILYQAVMFSVVIRVCFNLKPIYLSFKLCSLLSLR